MIKDEIERIEHRIMEIDAQIVELNNSCAEAMAEITGYEDTRILSYSKEEELNKVIDNYTSKIAKLIVEKEELEEEKRIWEED